MSLKQFGGVFGRNPTFNDVTIEGELILNGNTFTGLDYQGTWNASTNTPALTGGSGTTGEFYIVNVAGATDLDGITNWAVGDWAMFNGSAWQRLEGGANGNFVDLSASGNVTLGDASTDTVQVNGYMGVGGAGASNAGLNLVNAALTGSIQYGLVVNPTASSAAGNISAIYAGPKTAAATFAVNTVRAVEVANAVKGAGSTITNQHGVYIEDQTQGTNNYGITSLVSSGSNKWNIYASGTAANYFAGKAFVGTTTDQDGRLIVRSIGNNYASSAIAIVDSSNVTKLQMLQTTSGFFYMTVNGTDDFVLKPTESVFNDAGVDIDFRVESDTNTHALFVQGSDGNVGIGTSSPSENLEVSGANPTVKVTATTNNWAAFDNQAGDTQSNYIFFRDAAAERARITVLNSEDMTFSTGSSPVERLKLNATATVFNENGADVDFRVESDTNTHALFVDGGTDSVRAGKPSLATTATDGFLYIPTCAGTPTGTPSTISGMSPLVVDTTNNKLYFYSSGQWRDAGP